MLRALFSEGCQGHPKDGECGGRGTVGHARLLLGRPAAGPPQPRSTARLWGPFLKRVLGTFFYDYLKPIRKKHDSFLIVILKPNKEET